MIYLLLLLPVRVCCASTRGLRSAMGSRVSTRVAASPSVDGRVHWGVEGGLWEIFCVALEFSEGLRACVRAIISAAAHARTYERQISERGGVVQGVAFELSAYLA